MSKDLHEQEAHPIRERHGCFLHLKVLPPQPLLIQNETESHLLGTEQGGLGVFSPQKTHLGEGWEQQAPNTVLKSRAGPGQASSQMLYELFLWALGSSL